MFSNINVWIHTQTSEDRRRQKEILGSLVLPKYALLRNLSGNIDREREREILDMSRSSAGLGTWGRTSGGTSPGAWGRTTPRPRGREVGEPTRSKPKNGDWTGLRNRPMSKGRNRPAGMSKKAPVLGCYCKRSGRLPSKKAPLYYCYCTGLAHSTSTRHGRSPYLVL
jgi:hypothetical protein